MRPVDLTDYSPPPLPWTEEPEQQQLLWKLVSGSLGLFLSLFLIVTFLIDPPELKREQLEKVPERLAKLMLEKKRQPPPEIKKPKPEKPKPEPEKAKPKPEPKKPKPKLEKNPKPKPKTKPVTKLKPKKPTPKQIKKARDKAAKSGIMAMQNQLQSLRDMPELSQLSNKQLRTAKAGSSQRKDANLIGRKALDGSGGIQTTAIAKPQRATLASRQTTRVDAPAEIAAMVADAANEVQVKQRTREEISLVFDRHKSAFYSLYRRALRSQLGLQGRVVFSLEIDPSGTVTACTIVSSELNNKGLERKLRARVMLLAFEDRPIEPYQGQFHIDFVPAG